MRIVLPALLCITAAAGFLLWCVTGWVFPFTTDSLTYISTAEHILSGAGLVFNNIFVVPPAADVLHVYSPPGYPSAIALLALTGINPYDAAVLISGISYLFLPALFFGVFRSLLPNGAALCAAAAGCGLFSILGAAAIAWSDVPFLAIVLGSMILVARGLNAGRRWVPFIICAGLLAGAALMFRYVGVAWIITAGAVLITACRSKDSSARGNWCMAGAFGAGALVVAAPYFVRNVLVLGGPMPAAKAFGDYWGQAGIVAHLYLKGLSGVLFGTSVFPAGIFIVIVLFLGFSIWVWRTRNGQQWNGRWAFLSIVIYFVVYSLSVIHMKAVAFLPGNIDVDERLALQAAWVLSGGIIAVVYYVCERFNQSLVGKIIIAAMLGLLLIGQINAAKQFHAKQGEIKSLALRVGNYFPNTVPESYSIVSNVPDMVMYFSKQNARALAMYTPQELINILAPHRDFYVVLVKNAGQYSPAWNYNTSAWGAPTGYRLLRQDEHVDIWIPLEKTLNAVRQVQ